MAASPASSGSDEVSERGTIDISKEEVEALLKEKPKANKFNLKQKKGVHMMADSPATSDEGSHESGNDEFSNEEVKALLKEEPEAEEFNLKTQMEMKNHNKRLKLCIKWFQQVNENHNLDKVKLQSDLEAMHKKWFDAEMDMRDIVDHIMRKKVKLRKRYTTYKKRKRAEVADLKTLCKAADRKVQTLEAKLAKYEETLGDNAFHRQS